MYSFLNFINCASDLIAIPTHGNLVRQETRVDALTRKGNVHAPRRRGDPPLFHYLSNACELACLDPEATHQRAQNNHVLCF